MRRLLSVYQFLGPALLAPLGYWLWLGRYDGDHRLTLMTLAVPVVYAYVVPAVGTNVLKLWAIDTRFRLGRFRPHHGFVFGSAAAVLAFVCAPAASADLGPWGVAQAAFVTGSVFAFWNWHYDTHAIRVGKIRIHVQPHIPEKSPAGIAMEHALTVFGGFGAAYAAWLAVLPDLAGSSLTRAVLVTALGAAFVIAAPVGAFVLRSYVKYGVSGLRPLGELGRYDPNAVGRSE
jgi:hypothetical protein